MRPSGGAAVVIILTINNGVGRASKINGHDLSSALTNKNFNKEL
jgi:hypothetical protein